MGPRVLVNEDKRQVDSVQETVYSQCVCLVYIFQTSI